MLARRNYLEERIIGGGGGTIWWKVLQIFYFLIGKKEIMIICKNLGCISEYFLRTDPYSAITESREGNIFNAPDMSHQGALWKSGARLTSEGFRALENPSFNTWKSQLVVLLCCSVIIHDTEAFFRHLLYFVFALDYTVSSRFVHFPL